MAGAGVATDALHDGLSVRRDAGGVVQDRQYALAFGFAILAIILALTVFATPGP